MAPTPAKLKDDPDAGGMRLGEFDSVRLLKAIPATEGVMWLDDETTEVIPAGSRGAIVHLLGEDGPFLVELGDPYPAVIEVGKDLLARI